MAEGKHYRKLTVQMLAVVCLGLVLGIATCFGTCFAGISLVQRLYYSSESVTQRVNQEIRSFRDYVTQNQVASTDVTAVGSWNREHPNTQLTIKGLGTTISSNYHGAELMGTESGLVVQSGTVAQNGTEFPVNFSDGSYSVVIYEESGSVIENAVWFTSILVGTAVFLVVVVLYNQRLTLAILTLSRQIRQVSHGDLDHKILSTRKDEVGQLARDVDTMRLSIMEQLLREEAALQANSKLITAISHDVRTPLTALMGYLELMDDEDIPLEERKSYLQTCKNNAQRLKSLTDELFAFFLVFGDTDIKQKIEQFDAAMLIDQILLEHEAALTAQEFHVQSSGAIESGTLRLDLGHIRRVFDNLFSNVLKYADPIQPVVIHRDIVDGRLHVVISNRIPAQQPRRAESNRIGLQTCQRLVQLMDGEFLKHQNADSFTAELFIPLFH